MTYWTVPVVWQIHLQQCQPSLRKLEPFISAQFVAIHKELC